MCLSMPGEVIEVYERRGLRMGTVDFQGIRREACLASTPEAGPGSFVIVHVGFAISVMDREEAARSHALFADMEPVGGS